MKLGMDPSAKPLIFVVDDEPLLLELAAALLEPAGFVVKTFRDPDAALQAFTAAKPRPDVVITDYAMHQMTGLDLIRGCRQINPKQKIILVSGTVDEDVYVYSRVKPDRFLAKPYQAKQLIGLVQALLAD
jgi:CheY-like chemotaxis protein